MLVDHKIKFDIAIVNYQTRQESEEEENHAINLAKKYNLKCFTTKAPIFNNNFEKNARDFRYEFFENIINEHNYDVLLTAHQLNDQLEWFLMRLSKGAGLSELIGLQEVSYKYNYQIMRPLLNYTKDELLEYLDQNSHPYFEDSSNNSNKYERNVFRKEFANKLMNQFSHGIKRSFEYMHKDKSILDSRFKLIKKEKELRVLEVTQKDATTKAIDITLKELGYLLSASQREEITNATSIVIGGLWAIEIVDKYIYITPFETLNMPKEFKELCRVNKIPQKIRSYLYKENIDPTLLSH